jgi:hypothetical protein
MTNDEFGPNSCFELAVLLTLRTTLVTANILTSNGSGALRTFVLARKKYLAQVAERKAQPGGSELQPQSLVVSIDPGLLESLVLLRTFGADITRTTSVQDDHVMKWLDAVADR